MAPLRIGSLFTGTGALDLAVMDVFDAEVVWHSQYEPPDKNGKEDKNQYAAKILARHWPTVPNLGDITKVCWQCVLEAYGPVDVLTGGFPCQDVSTAGKRAGLTAGSRSGLWAHFARAIHVLRPRLVVIENVEGLLSTEADRGLGSGAEAVDQDAGAGGVLRALGAVLGDLATLGFDAEWQVVAASDVGAAHRRKRVIIYAWPAAADASDFGHERSGDARGRGHGSSDCGHAVADSASLGRGEGGAESAWQQGGSDAAERGGAATGGGNSFRRRAELLQLRHGEADLDWVATDGTDYGPAIRRWERILGRPAPWPTDTLGRLTPVFTEWMMGLPDGWVTCTPGLTKNAMAKALGNGVVPAQAAAALRLLHARAADGAGLNLAA
jgi:DNA (cytosine-5)-methyltransferase 1